MPLTRDTFKQPDNLNNDDADVLYRRSLLLIRTVVGVIGVLLPVALFLGENFYVPGEISARGSLSAYYHTAMRDLFVGALCVVGFMLMTYLSGQTRTWDFWLSFFAGLFVLGVAFVPPGRHGVPEGAPLCGPSTSQQPSDCSPIQSLLGESVAAGIHFTCAAIFILCLAGICFNFGYREVKYNARSGRATFHRFCGSAILAAILLIIVGIFVDFTIFGLTTLYVGEVTCVWAFGASWLIKGKDLRAAIPGLKQLLPDRGGVVTAGASPARR